MQVATNFFSSDWKFSVSMVLRGVRWRRVCRSTWHANPNLTRRAAADVPSPTGCFGKITWRIKLIAGQEAWGRQMLTQPHLKPSEAYQTLSQNAKVTRRVSHLPSPLFKFVSPLLYFAFGNFSTVNGIWYKLLNFQYTIYNQIYNTQYTI